MSEFYTVPMQAARTNDSYVIPTTTNGTIFSHHSAHEHTCKAKKKAHKLDFLHLFHKHDSNKSESNKSG
ncbi:hypothetical protein DASB73_040290 [Starmerella bacillaris]|uniref:Uncharacterized protein n=1 Tax=Starmerella bacillaris TaxID=1247836 RepID=A0AAV5RR29_STABA|nr:hypothetical protein DASB73_040290 [Starmerella bacillaris]